MSVKLLTEHHVEFLRLKGGCTGSSHYTLVKMPHSWKSHVMAQIYFIKCGEKISIFFHECEMRFKMLILKGNSRRQNIIEYHPATKDISFLKRLQPDASEYVA